MERDRGFIELGASSVVLVSIASNIRMILSQNITTMTLLEHSSFNALCKYLG